MSLHSSHHDRSGRMPLGLLVGAALSIGIGAWLFVSLSDTKEANPRHPMEFPAIEVDRDRLEAARTERYGEARKALGSTQVQKLIRLVGQGNQMHFSSPEESEGKKLDQRISVAATNVIPLTGWDGFVAAGRPVFEACRTELDALVGAVRDGELSMEKAVEAPPAERFGGYRANCGKILPFLQQRHLIDDRGRWREPTELTRTLVEIYQRLRWARIIRGRMQPLLQLTDYERRLLLRWRIENSAFPVEERRRHLERLREDQSLLPDYDVTLAAARLDYAAGDLRGALSRLREVGDGDANGSDQYRNEVRWLESKLKARKSSKDG